MLRTYGLPPPVAFAQDAAPAAVEPGIFELMATVRAPKSSAAWSTRSPVTGKSKYQPARAPCVSAIGRPHWKALTVTFLLSLSTVPARRRLRPVMTLVALARDAPSVARVPLS